MFDFRWMNHPDVSATGTTEAWKDRRDHDSRWIPLHPWTPEEEPRGETHPDAETGATTATATLVDDGRGEEDGGDGHHGNGGNGNTGGDEGRPGP